MPHHQSVSREEVFEWIYLLASIGEQDNNINGTIMLGILFTFRLTQAMTKV
jgi:hypothetical protein